MLASMGLTLAAISCQKKDSVKNEATESRENEKLTQLADKYYEAYLKHSPLDATYQGDIRYNDLLPDNISAKVISEEINFYNNTIKELSKINYEALDDQHKVIFDVLDNQLKTKVESYVYHPEYIPFSQFEGLPLTMPLLGSGKGSQPFKTVKDYDNWLKRIDQFPAWMATAEQNFRTGMKIKWYCLKSL